MNILVISTENKLPVTAPLWDYAKSIFDFEHVSVDRESSLFTYIAKTDFSMYDRVVIDSNLRRMDKNFIKLKKIKQLIIFEHDACQNNVHSSSWYKTYPAALKALGNVRIIVSGLGLSEQLKAEGIDAVFLPKAFDNDVISDLKMPRSIVAGFIGRTKHRAYKERKQFLARANKHKGVAVLRSEPGTAYNNLLNNINIFVSADIGYNEYMIKNFEAMAAGCTVMAWRQPDIENEALGFKDMENIVLYDTYNEFEEKLDFLIANESVSAQIALSGKTLVQNKHTWKHRANEILPLITPDIRPASPLSLSDRWKLLWINR